MSGFSIKSAPSFRDAVKALFSTLSAAFGLVAAAGAASQAVTLHRQPTESALRTLGMSGVSFKPYI
jgi:hypothetical protein